MNKNIIIFFGIILLLGLFVCSYLFIMQKQTISFKLEGKSINDLIAKNEPLKCTIESRVASMAQKSIIYVDKGRAKMETEFVYGGKLTIFYMLNIKDYKYDWGSFLESDQNKGVKINIARVASEASEVWQKTGGIGLDDKKIWLCSSWTIDEGVFDLPANIVFEDMTEQVMTMQSNSINSATSAPASSSTNLVP